MLQYITTPLTAKKKFLFIFLAILVFPLASYSQKKQNFEEPRGLLSGGKINKAIIEYDKLVNENIGNTTLMMEYAYALALGGLYENALMYLDRAILLGANKDVYFYSAQVLTLMGYDTLAAEFWTNASFAVEPQWITFDYTSWQQKYAQKERRSIGDRDSHDSIVFRRANALAARGMFLQSIVLFQELVDDYPNEFFSYIGYSTVLENVGMYNAAAKKLHIGIMMMKVQKLVNNDPTLNEAISVFEDYLLELEKKTDRNLLSVPVSMPGFSQTFMVYGGGMIAKSYIAVNARAGFYLTNSVSAALNLGIAGSSGNTYFNLGLSGYTRWKIFIVGAGLSGQFGNNNSSFGLQTTAGFSIPTGKRKQKQKTLDILFDVTLPFAEDAKKMFGISIGQTQYFGKRK